MSAPLSRPVRALAFVVVVVLVAAGLLAFSESTGTRSATLHFDRTVSIYRGSEVRVMGVRVGQVTAVVPEGRSVRVDIEYDETQPLPKDAKAAIVTPTLVADRFIQVTPAYTGGPQLEDGGEIALADSATPVELDRIYQSLADLTKALGPNGANKDGALDTLLSAGDRVLSGNGELGNRTIKDLSAAVETFGKGSGPLFESVRNLGEVTEVLAANDAFVSRFMGDLASVSAQLAGERDEMARALGSLSRAVGTVRTFVKDNKDLLTQDVERLTKLVGSLAEEKQSMDTFIRLGALGIQNLNLAFDIKTGTIGARLQLGPTLNSLDNVLCDVVANSQVKGLDTRMTCQLLKGLLQPVLKNLPDLTQVLPPSLPGFETLFGKQPASDLEGLVGRGR